jgi:glycosyltransferase involved in cell wall biosynthesis
MDVRKRYPALSPCRIDNGVVVSAIAMATNRVRSAVLRGVQISRLDHATKGQDLLLRALATINAKRHSPALTIDFIGDGTSLGYLKQLAGELGVQEHCNFLGSLGRKDVYARLCDYDMLIQPSRYEGFGLTVAEGMAAGIPVVVSDIDGPMEVIGQGDYGYFFASDDPSSLAKTVETVIDDIKSGGMQERTMAARQYVEDKYGLQRTSAQYCETYREVVASFESSR